MSEENWRGEKWIADAWQTVDRLKELRADNENPEEIRIIEENARHLIHEIRKLSKIAGNESALDHDRYIEEVDKIVDATLELIRG